MKLEREQARITVRMPLELKNFIEREACKNFASANSEIVRCIRERMKVIGAAEAATSPRLDHANLGKGKGDDYGIE